MSRKPDIYLKRKNKRRKNFFLFAIPEATKQFYMLFFNAYKFVAPLYMC